MSESYTWSFGQEGSGLYFVITYDGSDWSLEMKEGSMDLNALWFSDGDAVKEGDTTLSRKDSSLNMNGSGSTDAEGNPIVWDDVEVISPSGLGKAGTAKNTYLTEGETFDLSSYINFEGDIADLTIGVRSTSVNGSGSIKLVASAEEGDAPPSGGTIFVSWEAGIYLDDGNGIFDGGDTAITDSNNLADFDFSTGAWTVKAFVDGSPSGQVIDLGGFGLDDSLIIDVSGGFTGYTGRTTTQPANGADGFGRIKWFAGAFQSSHVTLGGTGGKGAAVGQVHIGTEVVGGVYFTNIAFSTSQVSVLWPTQILP